MTCPDDSTYMRRCLELASRAEGFTSPNPMVGSVIVHEGKVIGEGYHLKAGTAHAEVHAINSVTERSLLSESTLYVNLEPCSHHGRTPPCADLIISKGIKKVVVGAVDTSDKVAGRGIAKMRETGIEVVTGVEEKLCREINRRFFTFHEKRRPYVVLKWARSSDGFIDIIRQPGAPVAPNWITGLTERVMVHRWRAAEDAIIAGGATVRADNPLLDARLWNSNDPLRVIISRGGNIPSDAGVFRNTGQVILFTRNSEARIPHGETVILGEDRETVSAVLEELYNRNILSVLVEGGARIISDFVTSGLWDEARRFTGKKLFKKGVADPFPEMKSDREIKFETCTLDVQFNYNL